MTSKPQTIIDLSHPLNSSTSVYPGDPPFTCTPLLTIPTDGCAIKALSLGTHTGTHIDAPAHFILDGQTIDRIPLSDLIRTVRSGAGRGLNKPQASVIVVDIGHKKERESISWEDDILPSVREKLRAQARTSTSSDIAEVDNEMIHSYLRDSFLFLASHWSKHWSTPTYYNHPFLTRSSAHQIIKSGIKLIGVDSFSVDETPYGGVGGELGYEAHEVLLGAGVLIVENLRNLQVLAGVLYGNRSRSRCGTQAEEEEWDVCIVPLNVEGGDGSPVRAYAAKRTLSRSA